MTAQGALLIGMLVLIGLTAWRGLEKIHDGFNAWTWVSTGLVGLTLLIAALGVSPYPGGVEFHFTGKFIGVLLSVMLLGWMLPTQLTQDESRDFLWETWRFIKQIFPLLIVGVFAVGIIREIIKPEWIEGIAGQNTGERHSLNLRDPGGRAKGEWSGGPGGSPAPLRSSLLCGRTNAP